MIDKELTRDDGFVIPAYFTTRIARRLILWRKGQGSESDRRNHGSSASSDSFSAAKAWIDYDEEADVLYVSFKRPQKVTDTKFLENQGILLRYRDKELVGVTVLDASKRNNVDEHTVADTGAVGEKSERYGAKAKPHAGRRRA